MEEVTLSAKEVAEFVSLERNRGVKDNYSMIRNRCKKAVTEMMNDGKYETEVIITDIKDSSLKRITEELRDLDYKFAYIEQVDGSKKIVEKRLRISVRHFSEI